MNRHRNHYLPQCKACSHASWQSAGRESYREDGKVRKRTLVNLSCLPDEVIEGLKVLLRGGVAVPSMEEVFTVERTLPHGHVAAVLGSARGSGASSWFGAAPADLQPVFKQGANLRLGGLQSSD